MKKYFHMKNNSSGITLIALVITIIVMLILAGVTLSGITGEEGLLKKAKKAADETKRAAVKEAVDLWEFNREADKTLETEDSQSYQQFVDGLLAQELIDAEEKEEIENTGRLKIGEEYINFVPLDTAVMYGRNTSDNSEYALIAVAFEDCSEFAHLYNKLKETSAEKKVEYIINFINKNNPSAGATEEALYAEMGASTADEYCKNFEETVGIPIEVAMIVDGPVVTGADFGWSRNNTVGTITLPDGSSITTEDSDDVMKQFAFYEVDTNGTYTFEATTSDGETYKIAIDVTELGEGSTEEDIQ